MFSHVVLGLLRDGRSRHGYQLYVEYRRRSDAVVNAGNFYRELARLKSDGLLRAVDDPAADDKRRIPYEITDGGRQLFDRWLVDPAYDRHGLADWLLFVEAVPGDARDRILERYHQDAWMRRQALSCRYGDAARRGRAGRDPYDPLCVSLARRLKHASAEVEFVEELRGRRGAAARSVPDGPPQPAHDAEEDGFSRVPPPVVADHDRSKGDSLPTRCRAGLPRRSLRSPRISRHAASAPG